MCTSLHIYNLSFQYTVQYGRSTEVLEINVFCEKNNILPKQINHLMYEYGNFKGLGHEKKLKMFDKKRADLGLNKERGKILRSMQKVRRKDNFFRLFYQILLITCRL